MFKKNNSAEKCVAPLEPPNANGCTINFDYFSRRKWTPNARSCGPGSFGTASTTASARAG
jgi:hypothetical protein